GACSSLLRDEYAGVLPRNPLLLASHRFPPPSSKDPRVRTTSGARASALHVAGRGFQKAKAVRPPQRETRSVPSWASLLTRSGGTKMAPQEEEDDGWFGRGLGVL